MLTAFLGRSIVPPIRFDRDLFLAFGANDHFFPFRTDNYRTWGVRTPFFMMEHRRRTMTGTVFRTAFQTGNDSVRFGIVVTRRRPSRRFVRTCFSSCPIPFILDEQPSFVIRDVFIPI